MNCESLNGPRPLILILANPICNYPPSCRVLPSGRAMFSMTWVRAWGGFCFFVAWQRKVSRCIGIEINKELCRVSLENAHRFAKRFPDRGAVTIHEGDAMQACYDKGTVYFAFNPFGEQIFSSVLKRIGHGLDSQPRRATFVYVNPRHSDLFQEHGWKLTNTRKILGTTLQAMYFSRRP